MNTRFVEVVVPLPLRNSLTYHLPDTILQVGFGSRVLVPLGSRRLVGCLVGPVEKRPSFATKEILQVLEDEPLLSPKELKLMKWASAYYLTPPGEVLRHLIPPALFRLKKGRAIPVPEKDPIFPKPSLEPLNPEQQLALKTITDEMEHDETKTPILLHGITGSGKTEIYIEAVRKVIREGGQALVLVPEIGLTPQIVDRFRNRLQDLNGLISVYHSGLTPAQRLAVWKGTREGHRSVVIATRSGIFLQFPHLKMIVIDEEHDSSYKQEERFCYHARDLALWRGNEEKILVLLGSATPSLESLRRTEKGKMKKILLTQRAAGASLPKIELIDRRGLFRDKENHPLLSNRLLEAIDENLQKGEQTLLFLNRRGFSPFTLCSQCGLVPRCKNCDISLTLHHQNEGSNSFLNCHYCNQNQPFQPLCPHCQKGMLTPFGFGTERLDRELQRLFRNARIARMDRDAARGKKGLTILERMKKGEIDILIGTQMITKGHDYPGLTLVGIVDADTSLNLPDFRASERTYQLIRQVSGRAGRGEKEGKVLIQTYEPDHGGLVAAVTGDGHLFYGKEMTSRQEAGYPPFKRLIEIRLSGAKREGVAARIQLLSQKIQKGIPHSETVLLGPVPCPIEKVRGQIRWRLLMKTSHYAKIQPLLIRLLDDFAENDLPSPMKMLVNVDPMEMM